MERKLKYFESRVFNFLTQRVAFLLGEKFDRTMTDFVKIQNSLNQRDFSVAGWGGGLNSHNFFEKIIGLENLFLAWREFKIGKGQKPDVQKFEFNLEENILQLHEELKNQIYQHFKYTAFYITDPKLRHIHKACVRDRVLHHAIFRVLYLIFNPTFIFDSYSCRMGKGTHRAVKRLKKFAKTLSRNNHRSIFVLKCDVKKFFDSVDHEILLGFIKRKVKDERANRLIKKIIDSFEKTPGIGLPIGNVTSQLFANIYLNELDRHIKHELRVKYYIRYCDDFVILGEKLADLLEQIKAIGQFLYMELRLKLHPDKIVIRKYSQGIDLLGYVVRPHCITLRTKTKRRILKNVRPNNLPSYLGILKHCNGHTTEKKIRDFT